MVLLLKLGFLMMCSSKTLSWIFISSVGNQIVDVRCLIKCLGEVLFHGLLCFMVLSQILSWTLQRLYSIKCQQVVSWTAMITAYVKNRRPDEAFQLFMRMQVDDVKPNEFTIVNLLQASTQLGSLSMGRWVHDYAHKNGFVLDCFLGTALIDMYSKCGSLQDARKVFDVMQSKSLATWNSMITSLGGHGCGEEALSLFEDMEEEASVEPDAITFVGVLSACANTRNVKDGLRYFTRMIQVYVREHNACMIQLLEKALEVDEVSSLVDSMDSDPNLNTSFDIEGTEQMNKKHETPSQHQIMFSKWDTGRI